MRRSAGGIALLLVGQALPGEHPTPSHRVERLTAPIREPAQFPRFCEGKDKGVLLSWTETLVRTSTDTEADGVEENVLCFAEYRDGEFGARREIARGTDWFVNWADFPSLVAGKDESLAAHWLQKLGDDPYAYGVRVACSNDGGAHWSEPFWLHRDESATEHGFATLLPREAGGFAAVWLDGRDMPAGSGMGLRAVEFDAGGWLGEEQLLDQPVCECCATDAVRVGGRSVAVYRDRTPDEIRDISLIRQHADGWSEADTVHEDGWYTPG